MAYISGDEQQDKQYEEIQYNTIRGNAIQYNAINNIEYNTREDKQYLEASGSKDTRSHM